MAPSVRSSSSSLSGSSVPSLFSTSTTTVRSRFTLHSNSSRKQSNGSTATTHGNQSSRRSSLLIPLLALMALAQVVYWTNDDGHFIRRHLEHGYNLYSTEEDVATLEEDRPIIYTYQPLRTTKAQTSSSSSSSSSLMDTWKQHWTDMGWNPIVLTIVDAQRHVQYKEVAKFLPRDQNTVLEWLAVAYRAANDNDNDNDAWLARPNVYALRDFRFNDTKTNDNNNNHDDDDDILRLTLWETVLPSLVSGSSRAYTQGALELTQYYKEGKADSDIMALVAMSRDQQQQQPQRQALVLQQQQQQQQNPKATTTLTMTTTSAWFALDGRREVLNGNLTLVLEEEEEDSRITSSSNTTTTEKKNTNFASDCFPGKRAVHFREVTTDRDVPTIQKWLNAWWESPCSKNLKIVLPPPPPHNDDGQHQPKSFGNQPQSMKDLWNEQAQMEREIIQRLLKRGDSPDPQQPQQQQQQQQQKAVQDSGRQKEQPRPRVLPPPQIAQTSSTAIPPRLVKPEHTAAARGDDGRQSQSNNNNNNNNNNNTTTMGKTPPATTTMLPQTTTRNGSFYDMDKTTLETSIVHQMALQDQPQQGLAQTTTTTANKDQPRVPVSATTNPLTQFPLQDQK